MADTEVSAIFCAEMGQKNAKTEYPRQCMKYIYLCMKKFMVSLFRKKVEFCQTNFQFRAYSTTIDEKYLYI